VFYVEMCFYLLEVLGVERAGMAVVEEAGIVVVKVLFCFAGMTRRGYCAYEQAVDFGSKRKCSAASLQAAVALCSVSKFVSIFDVIVHRISYEWLCHGGGEEL